MGERLAHDHVVQAPAESTDEKMGGIESAKLMESLRKGIGYPTKLPVVLLVRPSRLVFCETCIP